MKNKILKIISNMGMFDSDDNEDVYGLEHNVENKEPDGYLVDVTKPIEQPNSFDKLCALINHYEEMEAIIDSLRMKTSKFGCIEPLNLLQYR